MTLVVDASVVAAALTDSGEVGRWAERVLAGQTLFSVQLMPAEVANVLRRAEAAGDITVTAAALAIRDLEELDVGLLRVEPLLPRIWELRGNVTAYDAWYVAAAEALGAPLATLDRRLARAAGPTCDFLLPTDL